MPKGWSQHSPPCLSLSSGRAWSSQHSGSRADNQWFVGRLLMVITSYSAAYSASASTPARRRAKPYSKCGDSNPAWHRNSVRMPSTTSTTFSMSLFSKVLWLGRNLWLKLVIIFGYLCFLIFDFWFSAIGFWPLWPLCTAVDIGKLPSNKTPPYATPRNSKASTATGSIQGLWLAQPHQGERHLRNSVNIMSSDLCL